MLASRHFWCATWGSHSSATQRRGSHKLLGHLLLSRGDLVPLDRKRPPDTRQSLSHYLAEQIIRCTGILFELVPHGSCVVKISPDNPHWCRPTFNLSIKLNTNSMCLNNGTASDNECCEGSKIAQDKSKNRFLSRHELSRYSK